MLAFEKRITNLFSANRFEFTFDEGQHLLTSPAINIRFVPVCSEPETSKAIPATPTEKLTIRLWEDIYRQRQAVVESRILSALGVSKRLHGRQTKVKEIGQDVLDEFIMINHLNVPTRARYRYGLFAGTQLVAVAAFGRSCPIQHNGVTYRSHELIRYGSLLNHTVVGGLSKLIRHFEQLKHPQHLMTSVDREWSGGRSYLKLGFVIAGTGKPQTFWLDTRECQRYYPHELPAHWHPATGATEGWRKITNLGNLKLVKFV